MPESRNESESSYVLRNFAAIASSMARVCLDGGVRRVKIKRVVKMGADRLPLLAVTLLLLALSSGCDNPLGPSSDAEYVVTGSGDTREIEVYYTTPPFGPGDFQRENFVTLPWRLRFSNVTNGAEL